MGRIFKQILLRFFAVYGRKLNNYFTKPKKNINTRIVLHGIMKGDANFFDAFGVRYAESREDDFRFALSINFGCFIIQANQFSWTLSVTNFKAAEKIKICCKYS